MYLESTARQNALFPIVIDQQLLYDHRQHGNGTVPKTYTGVIKKPQKFISEYQVFSQKPYLNMGYFEKVHICIPKIQYLHTRNSISADQVDFQTYFDFLSVVHTAHLHCCKVGPYLGTWVSIGTFLTIWVNKGSLFLSF